MYTSCTWGRRGGREEGRGGEGRGGEGRGGEGRRGGGRGEEIRVHAKNLHFRLEMIYTPTHNQMAALIIAIRASLQASRVM